MLDENVKPVRRAFAAARRGYEGSWVQDLAARLVTLEFGNWIILFGASLLLAVLPLIILLSSIADERIDDDLSRHLGLNAKGAHIIEGLFRKTPTHSVAPIVLGVLIGLAGTIAVASSLQVIYERAFDQEHRGWRDFPRFAAWTVVLFGILISEANFDGPVRRAAGVVLRDVVSFVLLTLFFGWTMHFLLAGRVPWRRLVRPAVLSALFWLGLALFSSVYFSSALISEHRLYGTIGVMFVLLSWFIAVGAIIVLGAACGAVWQERRDAAEASAARPHRAATSEGRPGAHSASIPPSDPGLGIGLADRQRRDLRVAGSRSA
jgi:membrane protein